MRKDRIFRKLSSKIDKQNTGTVKLMFPLVTERQQYLSKGLQIVSVIGGLLRQVNSPLLIAMNAAYFQKKTLIPGKGTNHVIARAEGQISILRVRIDGQKKVGIAFRPAHHAEPCKLLFLDQR